MTHTDFHNKLSELLYIEDHGMYDIIVASIVANSLKVNDPVWLTLIGQSSGGKSQVVRPLAKSRPEFIHRVDDMTANTFMSGTMAQEDSLLGRIGPHGIICMDDLTVLFSKNQEERQSILSQFRMVYDGRFSKSSGSKKQDLVWEGYMGMIGGSTPAIYRYLNEVADMGERFIIYRMKEYDTDKMLDHILDNPMSSRDLDSALSLILSEFIRSILSDLDPDLLVLDDWVRQDIKFYARQCSWMRTPVHIDPYRQMVDEFPQPEVPARVMKQLLPLAQAMQVVTGQKLTKETLLPVLWVAYSLANDKRRKFLRAVVGLKYYDKQINDKSISAAVSLNSEIVKAGMSELQALKIVGLSDENVGNNSYELQGDGLKQVVMTLDPPDDLSTIRDIW